MQSLMGFHAAFSTSGENMDRLSGTAEQRNTAIQCKHESNPPSLSAIPLLFLSVAHLGVMKISQCIELG